MMNKAVILTFPVVRLILVLVSQASDADQTGFDLPSEGHELHSFVMGGMSRAARIRP